MDIILVSATTPTNPLGYQNCNPYTILDVSPSASDKEVKRKYYQLCLKYHPDKLQQLSKKQRQEYEQMFKDIQWAYSEISSGNCRQNTMFPFHFNNQRRSYTSSSSSSASDTTDHHQSWEEYFRSQLEQQQYRRQQTRSYRNDYRSNESTTSNIFGTRNRGISSNTFPFFHSKLWKYATPSTMTQPNHPKFVFRQHVTIPLSDLYTGKSQYQFTLSSYMNNIFGRTIAAFRGGMGPYMMYQSILYAIPILRFSKSIAIATVFYMFHQQLVSIPSLEMINEYLVVDLLPGYKGETKFIFTSDIIHVPNMEVQIIIKEGKHPIYHRKNNDLYVTCTISPIQAKKGCIIEMSSLRNKETKIKVRRYRRNYKLPSTEEDQDSFQKTISIIVPPNTVSGDVIHEVGKGWPIRSKSERRMRHQQPHSSSRLLYGDLFVTIQVQSKKQSYHKVG